MVLEMIIATKKVVRYLQRAKEYMLAYSRVDNFEILGYAVSDLWWVP